MTKEAVLRTLSLSAAVVMLLLALAIPVSADGPRQLEATLSGEKVVGSGDPNGRGKATVRLRRTSTGKLCYSLSFRRIQPPNAALINRGGPGEDGDAVVELFDQDDLPVTSPHADCVRHVKRKVMRGLARTPRKYYVEVYNDQFPDGAIRGQLRRAR